MFFLMKSLKREFFVGNLYFERLLCDEEVKEIEF